MGALGALYAIAIEPIKHRVDYRPHDAQGSFSAEFHACLEIAQRVAGAGE